MDGNQEALGMSCYPPGLINQAYQLQWITPSSIILHIIRSLIQYI